MAVDRSVLGRGCLPDPTDGGSTTVVPSPQCPSRQPRRVMALDLPVLCLRMVLAWQPAATACLASCRAYHTSDIRGRRLTSRIRLRLTAMPSVAGCMSASLVARARDSTTPEPGPARAVQLQCAVSTAVQRCACYGRRPGPDAGRCVRTTRMVYPASVGLGPRLKSPRSRSDE